tara:strand:+ start:379 stop:687 length:309 start_codon:yes stop_codon:yes gene_type:complete
MSNKEPELPNINAKEFEEKSELNKEVEPETPMKEWMVNYIGEKHEPEDGSVTVEMIVETMAVEFPEFLLALAEENWIRGYRQAITDVDEGQRMAEAEGAIDA